jgi:hypothetical protein
MAVHGLSSNNIRDEYTGPYKCQASSHQPAKCIGWFQMISMWPYIAHVVEARRKEGTVISFFFFFLRRGTVISLISNVDAQS